ncbi:MAG: RNA 2',3'-cyclic phosphodiesterase [Burkholderiales bacterium]|nr:RNA 2',3'-cyclic phosphodiesterase [Burkholderiales bacterium]
MTPSPSPAAPAGAAAKPLRLFFALWPDDRVRAKLAAYARAVHERTGGRVMSPEGLHLTIAFLGGVEASRLDPLGAAAASVRVRPFDWLLDEAGYWRHNRIVWVGASAVPAPLGLLVADLRAALQAGGFAFDPRPFVPHATLVRKAAAPRELPPLAPIAWHVERFVLVRSAPGAEGSRYEIAGSWPARR